MTSLITAAALAVTLSLPAGESPAAPVEAMYAQVQQSVFHTHEGELGAKFLMVERAIKCQCGCGLDVHSCQFQMQCGTSPAWSERIRTSLEQGMTPDAIQAGFVADFGPTVLMAPPAEGFNLVGYLLPAVAIVTAGMLVGLLATGGFRREDEEELEPVRELSDEQARLLREEMRRMEEAESPDW